MDGFDSSDPDSSDPGDGGSWTGVSVTLSDIPWKSLLGGTLVTLGIVHFHPLFHGIYYGFPAGYPGATLGIGIGVILLLIAKDGFIQENRTLVHSETPSAFSYHVPGLLITVFASLSFVYVPEARYVSGIWLVVGLLFHTIGEVRYSDRIEVAAVPLEVSSRTKLTLFISLSVILILLSATIVPFGNSVQQRSQLSAETLSQADNSSLNEMPNMSPNDARMMTLDVGRGKATYSMDDPRYSVGEGDITYVNGTYYMTYPRTPEGILYNQWSLKQKGAFLVNMSTMNRDVSTIDAKFKCGEGMLLTDNIEYALKQKKPNNMYGEKFPVVKDGEPYMVVVRTRFEQQTNSALPYQVPRFAGVAVVDTDCNVKWLSPSEAAKSEMLKKNNVYPYHLAKKRAKATRLRNGFGNTLVGRTGVPKLSKVPSKNNEQPFLIPTENGTEMLVMLEPSGSGNGLKEVWMFDGMTGKPERVNVTNDLTGPARAVEIVREQNPDVNFGETVIASEVTPQFINGGNLYYMVRVVSVKGSGISYIAFVDAETNKLYRADTTAEVRAFINFGPAGIDSDRDSGKITGVFKVVKKNGDGNVTDTMVVGQNESVVIKPVKNATKTTDDNDSDK